SERNVGELSRNSWKENRSMRLTIIVRAMKLEKEVILHEFVQCTQKMEKLRQKLQTADLAPHRLSSSSAMPIASLQQWFQQAEYERKQRQKWQQDLRQMEKICQDISHRLQQANRRERAVQQVQKRRKQRRDRLDQSAQARRINEIAAMPMQKNGWGGSQHDSKN
ncbi:MAG: hypothetical protein OWS74_01470, partial [Firmicutes bacterium]|nr:hypothetical protein [Bacillota bacterium]